MDLSHALLHHMVILRLKGMMNNSRSSLTRSLTGCRKKECEYASFSAPPTNWVEESSYWDLPRVTTTFQRTSSSPTNLASGIDFGFLSTLGTPSAQNGGVAEQHNFDQTSGLQSGPPDQHTYELLSVMPTPLDNVGEGRHYQANRPGGTTPEHRRRRFEDIVDLDGVIISSGTTTSAETEANWIDNVILRSYRSIALRLVLTAPS